MVITYQTRIVPSASLKNSFFIPSKELIQAFHLEVHSNHGYIFKITHPSNRFHNLFVIWFGYLGFQTNNVLSDKLLFKFDSFHTNTEYIVEFIYESNMNHFLEQQVNSIEAEKKLHHQELIENDSLYESLYENLYENRDVNVVTQVGKYTLVSNIDSINVKPLSDDDFEILDLNKEEFTFQLLNQHRVLSNGMIFPFWVQDDVVIYLKVTGTLVDSLNHPQCIYILGRGTYFNIERPQIVQKKIMFFEKKVQINYFKDQNINAYHNEDLCKRVNDNRNQSLAESSDLQDSIVQDADLYFGVRHVILNKDWAIMNGIENGQIIELVHIMRYIPSDPIRSPDQQPPIPKLKSSRKISFGIAFLSSTMKEDEVGLPKYIREEISCKPYGRIYIRLNERKNIQNVFRIYVYHLNRSIKERSSPILSNFKEFLMEYIASTHSEFGVPFSSKSIIDLSPEKEFLISINQAIYLSAFQTIYNEFSNPENTSSNLFLLTKDLLSKVHIEFQETNIYIPNEDYFISDFEKSFDLYNIKFKNLKNQLLNQSQLLKSTLPIISHTLIIGTTGSGKTTFTKCLCHDIPSHVVWISCNKLIGERPDYISTFIRGKVSDAEFHSPSILVFDDLDLLCSAEHEDSMPDITVRLYSSLLIDIISHLSQKMNRPKNIICLYTVQSKEYLHKSIQDSNLFQNQYVISNPSTEHREQIIKDIMKQKYPNWTISESVNQLITRKTEGFSVQDLQSIIEQTVSKHLIKSMLTNNDYRLFQSEIFSEVASGFKKQSETGIKLTKIKANWDDVGGLENVIRVIRETFEYPSQYPEFFKHAPLKLPSGILLYGPTGCGKTYLAQIAAGACGLNFISVKGPEILNKYIGQSEENVRNLFRQAESAKPCILFFDEFDSIAAQRGKDTTGVTDRVVNQFLVQMDGVESREGVYVLAATSRPDLIDAALLRPGRLDKSLYCGFPDLNERLKILKVLTRQVQIDDDVDLEEIANLTEHFTGADLQGVISNASIIAAHEFEEVNEDNKQSVTNNTSQLHGDIGNPKELKGLDELKDFNLDNTNEPEINKNTIIKEKTSGLKLNKIHFLKALKDSRPSVGKKERERLQRIYDIYQEKKKGGKYNIPKEAHVTLA